MATATKPKPTKPAATTTPATATAAKPKPSGAAKAPLSLAVRMPDGKVLKTKLGGTDALAAVFAYVRRERAGQLAHLDPGALKLVSRGGGGSGGVRTFVEGGVEEGKT